MEEEGQEEDTLLCDCGCGCRMGCMCPKHDDESEEE